MARDALKDVSGAKRWRVLRRICVPEEVQQTPVHERAFYAVVPPNVPVDLYLDIDEPDYGILH